MVTQCTACLVWFRVTREQLHAAHGLVRCSACNTVFNALATLRHDMPEGAVLAGSTFATHEETETDSGVSPSRETEAPEIERKEGAKPGEEQLWNMADEGDTAQDESPASGSSGSPGLEPYLGMPIDEPESGLESESGFELETSEEADSQASAQERLTELDLYLASALDDESIRQLSADAQNGARDAGLDVGPLPSLEQQVDSQRDADRSGSEPGTGQEFTQQDEEVESRDSGVLPTFIVERGSQWQRRAWGLVLVVAALALAVQIVYAQRDALGRIFGLPRSEPVLQQYVISGAALDAAQQPGALVLKGALVNQGHRAQPLPLIRVTLTDRYGDTVGARILTPRQYGAGQKTLLHAHQHFMFHVKLADPGSSAVGFSLVLCKHHGHSILCQDS